MRIIWCFCLGLVLLFWGGEAQAGALVDRLAQFPHWNGKPPTQAVMGTEDLIYPDWMAGTWNVTSTLVDLVAPLAPDIVTPGFEDNRRYLDRPITFAVRFQAVGQEDRRAKVYPFLKLKTQKGGHGGTTPTTQNSKLKSYSVVADRAFNGLNIAKATLGDRSVLSVKTDPNNPNRQITLLPENYRLVSVVTSRSSETQNPDRFIATEISQQLFRSLDRLYFNEVETTTAYERQKTPGASIEAEQITAVYLSPQDPNYFAADQKPVSLYRYRLEFFPV